MVDKETLKIRIREGAGARSKGLRAHVQRRLDFALSGFQDRIGTVTVRLSRPDAARTGGGGATRRCEIEVELRPRTVEVEDTDRDLFLAIDNAAGRLQRSITRALEHERAWEPSHPRPAAVPPRVRR